MTFNSILYILLLATIDIFPSNNLNHNQAAYTSDVTLTDYWNEGLAEVSRYSLEQNRYKDVHPGEVIMIFVKEDFLTDKQVKNEFYQSSASTSVLKNIQTKKFTTGLYDYTISTNVFSPFNQKKHPGALKIQSMSAEWCGVTYAQLNHRGKQYQIESRSYFEKEGDTNYSIADDLLEDELYNLIRLDPKLLPVGNSKIIPSTSYCRMTHQVMTPIDMVANLKPYQGEEFEDKNVFMYQVSFPKLKRTKTIFFKNKYPYVILGWDDQYPSMFDQQLRTTSARLSHQLRKAYWNDNSAGDVTLRERLGLSTY